MNAIKFTFSATLCLLGHFAFAQTGQWKLAGNNLTGSEKLGSTNNAALNFLTNNKTRMSLTGAGNLNISSDQSSVQFALPGVNPKPMMLMFPSGTVNTNRMVIAHSSGFSNFGLQYTDAGDRFDFVGAGKSVLDIGLLDGTIGIGTASPKSALHIINGSAGGVAPIGNTVLTVENSTNNYISMLTPSANESGILFGNSSNNASGGIIYNNSFAPNGLQFRINGNTTSMTLTADGKLGIGSNPGFFKLKVSQNDGFGLNIANTTDAVSDWELFTSNNLQLFGNGTFKGSFSQVDGTYSSFSDERLKTNIKPMSSVLEKINQLNPSTYQFKNSSDQQEHDGFIAQDVMKVFPALVTHNINAKRNLDVYTLNYSGFGVIAVKAIQEQQTIIEKQQTTIEKLQSDIEDLKKRIGISAVTTDQSSNISKETHGLPVAHLNQNVPNPFTATTVISYYLPETKQNALIEIVSSNGQTLKTFPLTQKGNGQLYIKAAELSTGTYFYVLKINGIKTDSKQMILTK